MLLTLAGAWHVLGSQMYMSVGSALFVILGHEVWGDEIIALSPSTMTWLIRENR
jgi:hypothetical protein